MQEETETYKKFVEKFKPKKTTDDCYTPQAVYDAVFDWTVKKYGIQGRPVVRPFYPGGSYEEFGYPENCVVIDNPPFSILTQIVCYYIKKRIDFFLFAPALTCLNTAKHAGVNVIVTDSSIIYENGAKVHTAFLTNMGEYKIDICSELHDRIKTAVAYEQSKKAKKLPKYEYPSEVLTIASVQKIASAGIDLQIKEEECFFTRQLDCQKQKNKTIFGMGVLLSEKAAAEKAAAEKAAAEKAAAEKAAAERWQLSEREKEIIKKMTSGTSERRKT